MTVKEKQLVIGILTKKIIEQGNSKLLLAKIKDYIAEEKDITPAIYANMQLKAWLKAFFSREFYVSGFDELYYIGNEIIEARSASVIEAILIDKLKAGERVLCAKIPSILESYNGLRYQDFSNGVGMEEWIRTSFPSLDIQDKNLILKNLEVSVPLTNEYVQMEMLVQMDTFNKGFAWAQKMGNKGMNVNTAKNIVASSFWRAIIGQDNLYCQIEDDIIISFAFVSGILTEKGTSIFCVIKTDKTMFPYQWVFSGFCCPQEVAPPNSLHWLQKQIGVHRVKIAEIKDQLDLINKQKESTLAVVKDFANRLDTGYIPDKAILDNVSSYLTLWDSLMELLSGYDIGDGENTNINQIQDFFETETCSADIREKILTEFGYIVDFVDSFLTKTLGYVGDTTTPRQDFEKFQALLDKAILSGDFSEVIRMVDNYRALLIVMSSPSINNISEPLQCVLEHFPEMPKIPVLIINKSEDEYAPLLGVNSILNMIETYKEIFDSKAEDNPEITTHYLKECISKERAELVHCIPKLLHDLFSADNSLREIILAKENSYTNQSDNIVGQVEYTPYDVGTRLYNAVGNKNQMAEKYFILGLFFNTTQCGKKLLNIYREENDFESFQTIWQYTDGQSYATEDDVVFWITNCANLSLDLNNCVDEITQILKRYPGLFENPEFEAAYSSIVTQMTGVSDAYKQWISHTNIVLNEFEQAIADNELDKIYSMLDEAEELLALGYSENELNEISVNSRKDFATGLDDYSKGKRLLEIQGSKNRAAEKYFWQSNDKRAKLELFNIYYNKQDFSSVCWIVEQHSVDVGIQADVLRSYSDSLVKTGATSKLAALAVRYPEIWYYSDVLNTLASIASSCDFEWGKIHNWNVENPVWEPNAFERTLIAFDEESARAIAVNREKMLECGYSEEQHQIIEQEIQTTKIYNNIKDVAQRIFSLQGNFHRTYEALLLSITATDHDWAISELYQLYVFEQRFEDVAAYFNAYAHIRNDAENIDPFLKSLIALKKNELLLNYIRDNYVDFSKDECLFNEIIDIAKKENREKEIIELRRRLDLVPRNRFEANLIDLNKMVLQEYITSPSSLEALGYDWVQIEKIRDVFTKPFIEGKEGYAVADRVRKFLGDERSEPFFLETETDSRSAKSLFDIYSKQKRWNDLCDLYRRHDVITTWNNHYNSYYIKALSLATSKGNCEAYLVLLDNELKSSFSEVEYAWLYLRTLIGAEKFEQAREFEKNVLACNQELSLNHLPSFFDFSWNRSDETKEFIIRFIANIVDRWGIESFKANEIRMIITANGHLVSDDTDIDDLKLFLHQNHMESLMFYLNAYYGLFIANKPEERNQFYLSLIDSIDSFGNTRINLTQLMPYFEAYKYLDSQDDLFESFTSRLHDCFMRLAEKGELFTDNDLEAVLYVANSGIFFQTQIFVILEKFIGYLDTIAENSKKNELTLSATNMFIAIIDNGVVNGEEIDENCKAVSCKICNGIAEKWSALIDDATTEISDIEWDTFMSFLRVPYVTDSSANALVTAWFNKAYTVENSTVLMSRLVDLMLNDKITLPIDLLCDILVNFLTVLKIDGLSEDTDELISHYIKSVTWEHKHLETIIDALKQTSVFAYDKTNEAVENLLKEYDSDLYYSWIKKGIIFFTDNDNKQSKLLSNLLEYVKNRQEDMVYDNEDYQLLYEAVCHNPTQSNLAFLYEMYKNGGKLDQATILEALSKDALSENVNEIYNLLLDVLNEREVDWIERYSKWWQGLIHLNDEDQRTKLAVAYLGLSDEPISESTLNSLSKLLMSDIYNVNYLKCYFRVMRNISVLSSVASGKLSYLTAVSDPAQLVVSIRNCFNNKQYDLGMQLLRRLMEISTKNSSSAGQLLADIYTADNLRQYNKLCECIPDVFEWIRKLNEKDTYGEWKNLGRAVDIAIITNNEDILFEKFQDTLFQQHPGRAAVVIANLIKKHEFLCAKKWLEIALQYNNISYYAILENVLIECLKTNTLSKTDELKLATIPEDGNRRSLEFYGEFVFNAYKMGLKNECLSVMEYLFDAAQHDKAYFSTLISLCYLTPITSEYLVLLYRRIKNYFVLTQEENVVRVSHMLAILHACLDGESEEKNESVYAFCMRERPKQNRYIDLTDLEQEFQNWLESSEDRGAILQLVINAISGHWQIDDAVLTALQRNDTVSKKLVVLFPEAFCLACVNSALHNRNDSQYLERIVDVLNHYSQYSCAKSISFVGNLSDESVEQLSMYLDVPIEAPGVYSNIVKSIIDRQEEHPDDELFESEMTILFSLQPYINYDQYIKNKYGIRNYVDTNCGDNNRVLVLRALARSSSYSLEARGKLLHPGQYLSTKDYLMVINSAESYKEKLTSDKVIQIEVFDTFILLGKLMNGLLSSAEINDIGLAKFVNMANLLCQNGDAYKDVETLLTYCPAKWKICVRCVQELVQGRPNNILYVMKKDEFWKEHNGCASFVEKMARDFIVMSNTAKKKGQALLIEENRNKRRDLDWGVIKADDIRSANVQYNPYILLLNIQKRNPVESIGKRFQADINKYFAQMLIDDAKKNKQNLDLNSSEIVKSNSAAGDISDGGGAEKELTIYDIPEEKDFRKIGFISDAIEEWQKNRQTEIGGDIVNTIISRNKTDEIVSAIVSNLDNPNDKLRKLCVELGLHLFDKYCERSGLKIIVTDQAREVLYQTAGCISKGIDKKPLSAAIKTDVQLCIESYSALSELVEACLRPALIDLCSLINDYEVRKSFVAHIEQVRQIGTLLSNPMMPAEKLSALEKHIRICRNSQSIIDSPLKYHLIALINKEISSFRELANVTIEIYNSQGTIEEGYIFGRIQNTGNQMVKNVQMEVYINGVYDKTYKLAYLEGKTMVPFALQYEQTNDEDKLQYSLKAIYETEDNNKEETGETAGTLELIDPDDVSYNFNASYQTTRPAGKEDYIERSKIQSEIGRFYSPGTEFNSFPTMAIYGMRRTGKSSVLKKLERTLIENFGEEVLLVETSGEGATTGTFTHTVHSMLVRQVLKNKGDGFTSLCEYLSDNDDWKFFVEKWENEPAASSDFQWIEDFYSELCEKFLKSKKLVVLIDEVDKMNGSSEFSSDLEYLEANAPNDGVYSEHEENGVGDQAAQTNLWGIFSRITQRHTDPIRFVLCGSDYFTNSMVEGDNLTQFFQKIERLRVGRMSRNELELALNTILEKDTDIVFHPDTIPYLWTICDGLPWHAKLIVNHAISKKLIYETRNIIYPSDVMFSAGEILSSGLISTENNFGVVALRAEERVFVSILAKKVLTMNTFVSEDEIYQDFCKAMPDFDHKKSFDRAKKLLLTERQLIVSRDGPDGPKYRFACELYRLYNRGEKFIPQQFQIN